MQMTDIVPIGDLRNKAIGFAKKSISPATKRAYESDWALFHAFCQTYGRQSIPAEPDTVSSYLTWMAEKASVATITRRCTSITAIHNAAGHESPVKTDVVARTLKGIRREMGRPPTQPNALSWADLKKLVAQCGSLMIGIRDAAIMSLGWASALRRSELVALDIGDIEFCDQGIIMTIRRSKTDQFGKGFQIGIPRTRTDSPLCPVECTRKWLERRSKKPLNSNDPLFAKIGVHGRGKWWYPPSTRLAARMISEIVKQYARYAGMNPENYSAHSLRRGLATEAGSLGVPERVIARHTRHRSIATLRGYIESGTIWTENPLHAIYGSTTPPGRK